MTNFRNDPNYPSVDLSPEALERAQHHGRYLRSVAFRDLAVRFYDWLATPGRPAVDAKSACNGTVTPAGLTG